MVVFRKYKTKIMAIVVVALMIVFTIEPMMNYFSSRRAGGQGVIAHYVDGRKITAKDMSEAQQQLELLAQLGVGFFLRPQNPQLMPTQDLRLAVLGELLFAERATAIESMGYLKQLVARNGYGITDEQINNIYVKAYSTNMYWLLLVKEARMAGVRTPPEVAKAQLEAIVSRMAKGVTYPQFISSVISRYSVSEDQVLETFADLMSVIEYGNIMCSMQDRTAQQILLEANQRQETIDINYVQLGADVFADKAEQPGEDKIREQFERYKGVFAGDVNEDNPYGFGYKLPERAQLEYIAVKLDDIASTIKQTTQQETEEFYQQHLTQFAQRVPTDPNDPNSPLTTRTRGYAEVAGTISKHLYQQKLNSKAEQILLDAKSITEANLPEIDSEQNKPSDAYFKNAAVDYAKTAAQLSEKYKIKVFAGKTGLLTASDIQNDPQLGMIYLEGTGFADASLMRIVFAVEQLKTSELGPLDTHPPRLYENIGPLRDLRERVQNSYSGKTMLLMRIIRAEKAAEPESLSQILNTQTIRLDRQTASDEDTNSIKDLIVRDLKHLAAMTKTKDKAEEFVRLAAKDGWDNAVSKFNKLYGNSTAKKTDANTISNNQQTFSLQSRSGIRKISVCDLSKLEMLHQGNPLAHSANARARIEGMLVDKLFALVPEDSNTMSGSGTLVEHKPDMSYYCIKDLTIHRLYQEVFDRVKTVTAVRNDQTDAQAMAVVHYNPKNVLKRMNFSMVREQRGETRENDANAPPRSAN